MRRGMQAISCQEAGHRACSRNLSLLLKMMSPISETHSLSSLFILDSIKGKEERQDLNGIKRRKSI